MQVLLLWDQLTKEENSYSLVGLEYQRGWISGSPMMVPNALDSEDYRQVLHDIPSFPLNLQTESRKMHSRACYWMC